MIPTMDGRRRAATGRRSARGGWLPSLTTPSRLLEHHQRSLERRAAVVAAYRARRLRHMAAVPGGGGRPWESLDLIDARSRDVDLPGGGRLFVHEIAGPPGAATLVLLHGWRGTAAGNWATAMPALARDFHVVAPDLRGHDAASADDVMAMADALGVERFVAVGYSLGSAVAVRLGRHHPDRVAGLVLCAAAVSIPPAGTLGDVGDIPTAVVVTRQDRLIPEWRQLALARSLRGASVHPVDGNHFAFARADVFVPALLDACHSVARSPRGDRDLNV